MLQILKHWLVKQGPQNPLTRLSLRAYGRAKGFGISFQGTAIHIEAARRRLIMSQKDYTLVPIMLENHDKLFRTVQSSTVHGIDVLDVSQPRTYEYKRWGLTVESPGLPEDDSIDAYTKKFIPVEGMTVLDVGAHAGLTTYFLSKMVGETGHVYAFEPDAIARTVLLRNIEAHRLVNVEVVPMAVSDTTGLADFNEDGSMAAGLTDHLVYASTGRRTQVQTVTLESFIRGLSRRVDFVKMDIEGAEVAALKASGQFIQDNRIHFALDSYHRMPDGRISRYEVEDFFRAVGYGVESSAEFGEMFTWAWPI
jgi:FkbM family methyltransferase